MKKTVFVTNVVTISIAILGAAITGANAATEPRLNHVDRAMLCVTEGALDSAPGGRIAVNVPRMRAYLNRSSSQTIEARLTYLGSTANETALASGEMRRQFGLKLRAGDACNLIYAMWRIEPESKLVVSVKENPGQHSSAECGNQGYRNIKPLHSSPVPQLHAGDSHLLRAELKGEELHVFVDDTFVWDGMVSADLPPGGPVGIRSDNAKLQLELLASDVSDAAQGSCKTGVSESE